MKSFFLWSPKVVNAFQVRLELIFCKDFDYCHVFLSRRLLLDPTPQYHGCRKLHSDAKPKDPFTLAQRDLKSLYDDIRKVLFFFFLNAQSVF